jgi:hypothetical protein
VLVILGRQTTLECSYLPPAFSDDASFSRPYCQSVQRCRCRSFRRSAYQSLLSTFNNGFSLRCPQHRFLLIVISAVVVAIRDVCLRLRCRRHRCCCLLCGLLIAALRALALQQPVLLLPALPSLQLSHSLHTQYFTVLLIDFCSLYLVNDC